MSSILLEKLKKQSAELAKLVKDTSAEGKAAIKKSNDDLLATREELNKAKLEKEKPAEKVIYKKLRSEFQDVHGSDEHRLNLIHKSDAGDNGDKIAFHKACDELYVAQNMLRFAYGESYDVRKSSNDRAQQLMIKYRDIMKAMDTATATEGSEWIPRGLSSRLWEFIRVNTVVSSLFPQIEMPTDPFDVPIMTAGTEVFIQGESLEDNAAKLDASQVSTSNVTLDAKKFAVRTILSTELEEDAVFAVAPMIVASIMRDQAEAYENAFINSDTAATHQDSNVTAANDVRKAFLGWRAKAIDESFSSAATGAIVATDFLDALTRMGRAAINRDGVVCVTGPQGWNIIQSFDDVRTVDKYGPKASILTGEVGKLFGVAIVISGQYPENLNASGVVDDITTDNTAWSFAKRDAFLQGNRRNVIIKTKEDIETDQTVMVSTARHALIYRFPDGVTTGNPIDYVFDVD